MNIILIKNYLYQVLQTSRDCARVHRAILHIIQIYLIMALMTFGLPCYENQAPFWLLPMTRHMSTAAHRGDHRPPLERKGGLRRPLGQLDVSVEREDRIYTTLYRSPFATKKGGAWASDLQVEIPTPQLGETRCGGA